MMFFHNWSELLRIVVIGISGYISLILLLRLSGKRTLSKMNAFDFVVTVAIGSTLATILLNKKISLAEGVTAFIVLIGMQYIVAFLSVRFKTISSLIKSEPQLLYYDHDYMKKAMERERIMEVEILQAVRSQGIQSIEDVKAVVLETDGSMSIIKKSHSTQSE